MTTSSGTATLVVNPANNNIAFPGTITNAAGAMLNFAKAGTNNLILDTTLSYSGTTSIIGGTLTVQDWASLAATAAINVNWGTLSVSDNGNWAPWPTASAPRPSPSTAATLLYTGRARPPRCSPPAR